MAAVAGGTEEPLSQACGLPAQHKARPSGALKGSLFTSLQTPYEIKLPACTRKHLNINVTNTGKGNNRRWQAPGGQRVQRANSAGRFRHGCTRSCTSWGDVGDSPTYFKEGSSVLTVTQKMNKPHREIKVDFGLYTKSCGFSVTGITLCHEIFRFFSVFQPETLLRVAFVNF